MPFIIDKAVRARDEDLPNRHARLLGLRCPSRDVLVFGNTHRQDDARSTIRLVARYIQPHHLWLSRIALHKGSTDITNAELRVAAPHILRFNAKRMGKRSHVFPITMLQHGNQQADFVLEMVYDRRLGQSACFGYLTNGKAPKPVL